MTTTRALDFARYMPPGDPDLGDTITVSAIDPLATEWTAMTSGGAFVPAASGPGQTIVSNPGAPFMFGLQNVSDLALDMGVF
jgi:hypothetical protein